MATTTNLGKVHVFPSEDSYNTNKSNVGANDLALVPIGAATTSEYGLTRLASEADVLSEAEGAVVHVPLAYELNDFRRLNTAYKVGDKVNCAFRFEFYLECTQAGTTSKNTLDTRNVTFGQTITDGTVKWIVRAHVKSVNGNVPDASGNITLDVDFKVYGLGTGVGDAPDAASLFPSLDLNDINKTGFYSLSGAWANIPEGAAQVAVIQHIERRWRAGTSAIQIYSGGSSTNDLYFRNRLNDTWQPWKKIATIEDVDGLTTLTNDGIQAVGGVDFDTLTAPGFYHVNATGSSNRPPNVGATKVIVLGKTVENGHLTQVAFPIYTTESNACPAYRSRSNNGNWDVWKPLAVDSNVVHLTGSEEISGNKIFNNLVQSNYGFSTKYKGNTSNTSPNFSFEITDYTKGDTPSKYIEARYYLYGYNQNGVAVGALAGMLFGVRANKNTFSELRAFKNQNDVSTFGSIGVEYDAASDSYITYAPHPASNSKDNSIATTKHVDNVKNALLASNNSWTGANTFVDDQVTLDGSNIVISNKDAINSIYKIAQADRGEPPATNNQELLIRLINKSGFSIVANTLSEVSLGYNTAGDSYANLFVSKTEAGETSRSRIGISYNAANKRFITYSPTPPSNAGNTEIATVGFVKDRIAEGSVATLKATRTSAGSFTVSGLKVGQPILLSCYLTNNTYDGGDYSAISSDNVSGGSFQYVTGASSGRTYTAIAIADATSVTFNVTNHGITSATWKVYAL